MKCFRDTNQRDVLTGAFPYTAEGPRLCFYGHCIGDCGDCGNRCGLHGARLSQFLVGCCAHTVAAGPQGGVSRGRRTTRGRRWAPTRTASAWPSATSASARPARAARARGSRSFEKSAAQGSMSPSTFRTRTPRTAAATGARSTRSCHPWTSRSPRTTSTSATATAIRAGCAPPPAAPCAATQCRRAAGLPLRVRDDPEHSVAVHARGAGLHHSHGSQGSRGQGFPRLRQLGAGVQGRADRPRGESSAAENVSCRAHACTWSG